MSLRNIFTESEKLCLQELIVKHNLHKSTTLAGSANLKRMIWMRLTEEFNTIETNTKRTEAQLKKCWDNLKTRQKAIIALEKRQRMRTGGGRYSPNNDPTGSNSEVLIADEPQPTTQLDHSSSEVLIAEALNEQTDVEIRDVYDSDTIYIVEDTLQRHESQQPDTRPPPPPSPPRHAIPLPPRAAPIQGPRNVRSRVIEDEFNIRQQSYEKKERREEVLFELQKKEREWLLRAAEENYKKNKEEREAAEELLHYNKIKRELAEIEFMYCKSKIIK